MMQNETKLEKTSKKPKSNFFKTNKFKRGGMATLLSVVFIAIVVVLNILVSALSQRFPSMNLDMTASGSNTLSDQALEIAKSVENPTEIYIIGDENTIRKDQLNLGYGLKYSQVANLTDKLHEANSLITVEYVDPDENPALINEYPSDNLTTGKVLVRTEKRYKVLASTDLFNVSQNQSGGYSGYSMVDSALASALEAVNLDTIPVVAMLTGHEEVLSTDQRTGLDSLLEEENFQVQEVNIMTEEIPEEAQILVIAAPTTDYTEEEIQKLRTYLEDSTAENNRTLLVTCYPAQGELPLLNSFLEEWGVKVEQGVVAETDTSQVFSTNASYIFAQNAGTAMLPNEYNLLVAPQSSPLTLVFDSNDGITTQALLTSSDTAYIAGLTEGTEDSATGTQTLATYSTKEVAIGSGETSATRNVAVFGSTVSFVPTILNTTTFSNGQYMSDLFHYCTGTDESAVTVESTTVETNTVDITASINTVVILGLGVFTIGIPVVLLIAGLVVFLKRRHL